MKSARKLKPMADATVEQRSSALGRPPQGLTPPLRTLTPDDVDIALHRELAQSAKVKVAKPEDFERIRAELKK